MKPKSRCLVDVSPVTRVYFQVPCFYQGVFSGSIRILDDLRQPHRRGFPRSKMVSFLIFFLFTSRIFENDIQQVKYISRFFPIFSKKSFNLSSEVDFVCRCRCFPKNIGKTMLNFLCFEARGHTFSGKTLVRRPVPVDSEGSSDELERGKSVVDG